jgi:hypothetical protein
MSGPASLAASAAFGPDGGYGHPVHVAVSWLFLIDNHFDDGLWRIGGFRE